jgi:hypothetical protein
MSDVRPPEPVSARRRASQTIALGDEATLEEGPELLQLLMRPYATRDSRAAPAGSPPAGPAAPLGRGIHPMTTVPLGLAIDAAIEAAGGYDLDVTTLRYCSFTMESFTSNRRALQATGRIVRLGRRHIEAEVEVHEGERLILTGRVGLVRVRGGKATELGDRTRT